MTLVALAILFRMAGLVSLIPLFGERAVPARVKFGIAFALTLIILPLVDTSVTVTLSVLMIEVVTGAFLGVLLRLTMVALQTAGTIAAQATSLSQLFGGGASEPMPALGHFLIVSALAVLALSGFQIYLVDMILISYDIFPMGVVITAAIFSETGLNAVAKSFDIAVALAAPFTIASLLYNFMLGAINKAMPQLMVALVGAPAITFLGMFLFLLASPLMLSTWQSAVFAVMRFE